jgi:inhibitor of cysteine peptidase
MRGRALAACGLFAAACAGSRALEADRAYQAGVAQVERIAVDASKRPPSRVHVEAFGTLPDACTEIDRVRQRREGAGVDVTLTTRREARSCEAAPRPFQRSILLDVSGLPPGLYFVDVNGVRGTFQIFEDLGHPDRFERRY